MKAHYFGAVFDEVPIFSEIKHGTAQIEKIPGANELFKLAHSQEVSLVRHIDLSWNTVEPSLILMYEKLIALGFAYCNGEMQVVEPNKGQNHV